MNWKSYKNIKAFLEKICILFCTRCIFINIIYSQKQRKNIKLAKKSSKRFFCANFRLWIIWYISHAKKYDFTISYVSLLFALLATQHHCQLTSGVTVKNFATQSINMISDLVEQRNNGKTALKCTAAQSIDR